jgi:hypothetical protein
MITHLVLMQFATGTDEADIRQLERQLDHLPNVIMEIQSYEFGRDVVRSERSYDFGLVALFANLTTLQRYQQHPEHQKVLAHIRRICRNVRVVDFENTPPGAFPPEP